VLLLAGSIVVHQSRYLLERVQQRDHAAYQARHTYLATLIPSVAVLLGIVFLAFCIQVLRAARGREADDDGPRAAGTFRPLWRRSAVALTSIFYAQELLEGALSGQLADVLSLSYVRSGWLVIVLAVVVGAAVAALCRGAQVVIARVGRGALRPLVVPAGPPARRPAQRVEELRALISSRGLSGRAPPSFA
jgi:4-amino-4-deoxy-L-arabinose transferase-like glycosyltransferase